MKWKVFEHSHSQVINAGKIIKSDNASFQDTIDAMNIIDSWRAAHAYPLHVIYVHLKRMAETYQNTIVAERFKRLDSIISKLKREPHMNLWTMQDLGGCRVVVPKLNQVHEIADKYRSSRIRHIYKDEDDYILSPRTSGYRSYHLVYQYCSERKDTYNRNMLIEIQLRTRLQHLWATAVETMGLYTKQALKAGQGELNAQRFFALISSLFAIEEGTTTVPYTSNNPYELINELNELNNSYHYLDILTAIRMVTVHADENKNNKDGYYVLTLNYETRSLTLQSYAKNEIDEAMTTYSNIEKTRTETGIDAVLVSVSSFSVLKMAYPNYFSDIGGFVEKVRHYIS